ncbi:MAG TPA: thermonuclease family protein [Gaiellaceae bacterium]|nr:thermonuclease family protein [Gaiellaceae bacterium]
MARVLAALLLVLALAGCSLDDPTLDERTVGEVVDGDTIVLEGGERVRLVQIDAPELAEGECYGLEARRELERLLPPGADVRLERDALLDDVDRFGRLLRYVEHDGVVVNVALVRRGAASVWFFDGDRGRHADELLVAVEEARAGQRGLWGSCPAARLDPERGVETR